MLSCFQLHDFVFLTLSLICRNSVHRNSVSLPRDDDAGTLCSDDRAEALSWVIEYTPFQRQQQRQRDEGQRSARQTTDVQRTTSATATTTTTTTTTTMRWDAMKCCGRCNRRPAIYESPAADRRTPAAAYNFHIKQCKTPN